MIRITNEQLEKSKELTEEAVREANKPEASRLMKIIAEAQAETVKQMAEEMGRKRK